MCTADSRTCSGIFKIDAHARSALPWMKTLRARSETGPSNDERLFSSQTPMRWAHYHG